VVVVGLPGWEGGARSGSVGRVGKWAGRARLKVEERCRAARTRPLRKLLNSKAQSAG
jgi:hypothetical protein